MNENVEPLEPDETDAGEDNKRQRSTIGFPYTDYDAAAAIATAIHGNVGHGQCTMGQLAAWMSVSAKSSSFRMQLSAAKLFGLIESDDSESLRLAELGRRILDPHKTRAAKAEAFLRVPLFRALYEHYKDGVTPPNAALEREIVSLGVGEKQRAKARQTFESSAQQTGFREAAPNRLVMPAVVVPAEPDITETKKQKGNGCGGGEGIDLDPLLLALLHKIPKRGEPWPGEKRVRWFKTFAMNVSQVYDDDDAPVELEVSLKLGS